MLKLQRAHVRTPPNLGKTFFLDLKISEGVVIVGALLGNDASTLILKPLLPPRGVLVLEVGFLENNKLLEVETAGAGLQ